ncbi:MAG TPA: hypothetical protein VF458_12975 [Ktedonobacteraceae bacterium]
MMDYRAQRDYDRAQRRAYRHQRRGYYGGVGGVIWLIIIISMVSSHWFWMIFPWLFIGLPIFWWGIRPMLRGNAMNQQQQQPYSQPVYQQPEQQQPDYQAYNQGYSAQQQPVAQPRETYQEGGQSYQYQPGQQQNQQYEEPLTMYPQE